MSVFDLKEVGHRAVRDLGNQGAHCLRLMSTHLLRKTVVMGRALINIYDVDFVENFVELVVIDDVMFFADGDESEINAVGEGAAEIVDADGTAMGEGIGEEGGDEEDFEFGRRFLTVAVQ